MTKRPPRRSATVRFPGVAGTTPRTERLTTVPGVRVKDSRGMQLLARLVERPDEEIHVLVLASDEGGSMAETSAGDQLDERARREYKTRLADLEEDIVEAERNADRGRLEKLRREADALKSELARAVGLGGKSRQAGSFWNSCTSCWRFFCGTEPSSRTWRTLSFLRILSSMRSSMVVHSEKRRILRPFSRHRLSRRVASSSSLLE